MKHPYLENMRVEFAFEKTYPTYSVVNIQILKTRLESFACMFFLMGTSLRGLVESLSSWLYDEIIDSFPKVTQNIPCKLGHYECSLFCHRVIRGNDIDNVYSACICCICKLISICSVLPCQKWYKIDNWFYLTLLSRYTGSISHTSWWLPWTLGWRKCTERIKP